MITLVVCLGASFVWLAQIIQTYRQLVAPDALELATRASKEEISRDFATTAWRRLYRSRVFLSRLRRGAPEAEIEVAWVDFLASVEEMASKVMVYTMLFGEFYGDERRREYENGIQLDLNRVTEGIVTLRYGVKQKTVPAEELAGRIKRLEGDLTALNIRLYKFARCFDKQRQTQKGCRSTTGQIEQPVVIE